MADADGSKPASGSAADIATEVGSLPSGAAPRPSDPELWRVRDGVLNVLFGDPIPTRLLGRYTLVRKIGAGGMGEVHLGEDPQLHRRVAIKLLPAWEHEGRDVTRKLLHEARAIARLAHPNVVEVFDVGVHAGVPFIVMELVEGGTLADWLDAREHTTAEIVAVLLEAGAGLAAAHRAGVLHRDFKPANVLVGKDGRMRVADFGLALDAPRKDTTDEEVDTEASTLELGGTPAFMPPEQHAALPLDARADVYAFCVTAHLACWGVLPFRGSLAAICAAKLGYDGSPPSGRAIDARVHDVIARGLHPDRERRWPSMDAVCDALARSQRPRSKRALVITGVAALVSAAVVWSSAPEPAPCDADAALSGVWDRSRRAELARQPVVTGSSHGEQLLSAIDDEAARWRSAWQRACEGPALQRDAAMACLGRSRQELDATLAMFAEGDPAIDARALDLLDGRDEPSSCNDVRAPSNESPERAA
ncbi:MAG TPA: serine/threonine-protein kinase, partial [Nannocystaceae bacterium]|nr:serine/threonine-protein kinase [Nannocystaceae bacterium]